MRRAGVLIGLLAALLLPAAARAAAPGVDAVDVQGVSALLRGSVEPGGSATTYYFEYTTQASFEAGGFAAAVRTPARPAGTDGGPRPARAAISGLTPDTTYRFRLRAQNGDGDGESAAASLTTTHGFGFLPGTAGFAARAVADGDGDAATLAGSHPYELRLGVGLELGGEFEGQPGVPFPDGDLRDLRIQMPPGLVLNPATVGRFCAAADFQTPRQSPFEASASGEQCPGDSQVGTVEMRTSSGGGEVRRFGLFNLKPAPGVPAQLGFAPFGTHVVLSVELRQADDGSYPVALTATNFPQALDLSRLDLRLWGVPRGAAHNGERGNCLNELEPATFPWGKCSVGTPFAYPPKAFVTLPGSCGGPLSFTATATSWQQPGTAFAAASSGDPGSEATDLRCGGLSFGSHPVGLMTTKQASTPSGFHFELDNEAAGLTDPDGRAPAQVRRAVVALPEGATINPSLAVGLGTCAPAQFAAETAFSEPGAGCPNAANIGKFSVDSPLFEGIAQGQVYLAQPDDPATPAAGAENPFDTMIAVYLVARLPARGLLIRAAGKLVPDPRSGRVVGTFERLPQLPYDDLQIDFRATQRAALITPASCGGQVTRTELSPWGGVVSTLTATTPSTIESGPGGGPCPSGPAPFAPQVSAGGVNSSANSYTPYFVHISRRDNEQEITSYSLTLPRGITGKLAGIPFCPEAAIAAARGRGGADETANPSCPAASQIGRTDSAYGIGAALARAPGRVYLAGPYNGQPLSVVTVNSATIGPFDLGTVVIRSAFAVDPVTAQLRIDSRASDPIPHILQGIPLHLRDVRVYMDRAQFTRNPSSCEPAELVSTLTGAGTRLGDPGDDSTATASSFYQLLSCRDLGFHPRLGLRLRGGSRRGQYPSLRATFAARGGDRDANLKRIEVTMPHALFLAQNHIRAICTRAEFAADRCPAASIYGRAVAATPLFDAPLTGPIYLRSSDRRLPDLVASLHSGSIRIVLTGRIGPAKHGIRALFDDVPDAPIDRFTMILNGGHRGLLVNSSNICAAPPLASVKALGQNNQGTLFTAKLRGQCRKAARKGDKKRGGRK